MLVVIDHHVGDELVAVEQFTERLAILSFGEQTEAVLPPVELDLERRRRETALLEQDRLLFQRVGQGVLGGIDQIDLDETEDQQ